MPRVFVILATVLSLLAVSCGDDTVSSGGELLPTPVPAPTVAGQIVDVETPEIQVETVLIGVSSSDTIMVHALPGSDQPLAGDVPPGTSIEPMGQAFETEDGVTWWQVRAGNVQGWIVPTVAYRGPANDVTEQLVAAFGDQDRFESPEAAARALAQSVTPSATADIVVVSTTEIATPPSATVTVDILEPGDDSVAGTRLIVASRESTGWQPETIFETALCYRGVSADGLCL